MTLSLIKASVLALALASPAAAVYTLKASDWYHGSTFFDNFNFIEVGTVNRCGARNYSNIAGRPMTPTVVSSTMSMKPMRGQTQ